MPALPCDRWIDHCYDNSVNLDESECGCVYDYLRARTSQVPEFNRSWATGGGLAIGVEAFNQCY